MSMIKRTIEVSREPAHLCVRLKQLVLKRGDETAGSIPCEDLGVVVVDHPQTTYTHAALAQLCQFDVVVVLCGPDHLPCGLILPLAHHSQVVWRLGDQLAASKPCQKRLWQQIVKAKIAAQAANLDSDSEPFRRMEAIGNRVRSGDPENCEAQAARLYWASWLWIPPTGDIELDQLNCDRAAAAAFRRDADAGGLNGMLNYGYAILRAAVARAIVVAGLNATLGIHHHNRSNPFCLADDLMEPLRPLVDATCRELFFSGVSEVNTESKAELLGLLTAEVQLGSETGPLFVSLHRYVNSFIRCLMGEDRDLLVPVWKPEATIKATEECQQGKRTTECGADDEIVSTETIGCN
jgi:CRISP-associated protein Cas1